MELADACYRFERGPLTISDAIAGASVETHPASSKILILLRLEDLEGCGILC